jgi:hypothetical protein
MDLADVTAIFLAISVPIALLVAALRYRHLWRAARRELDEARGGQLPMGTPQELMHAVDAIAVEVERVSEGQRYLTKVLADREATSATRSAAPKNDNG